MRIRLPAVHVRGGGQSPGEPSPDTEADQTGAETGGGDAQHATVRDDPRARARPRLAARLPRPARRWPWLAGWAFAALTVTPALLAVAWLVPGIGMLLAGRLLPLPMLIIFAPLAVAACYFAMRGLPARWPSPGAPGASRGVSAAALAAMVAVAAGFGAWQALLRSEPVLTVGDPGVYLQYGYWIAGHASVRIPASAAAFGTAGGLDFATTGFPASGGTITPSLLPGLPLLLAGGTWLGGLRAELIMPAVLGGCAILSFGGLVGRLVGGWQAVVGELVLSVCLPEIYVSRTPMPGPLVQVLLFGGLCLLIDSFAVRGPAGRGTGFALGGLALAGLGGVALGLTTLASIGSLGLLLPVFPVLAVLFVTRKPQAWPFAVGFFVGIGLGLAAALALARSYLDTLSPQLHLIGLSAAAFGVATVLLAPLASPAVRSLVRRACAFQVRFPWFGGQQVILPSIGTVAGGLVVAAPVLALAALALRPYLQVVRGQTNPAMIRAVAALQRLERLPVDGTRQYYESSLYWVFWYLGVPAVLLACAGTVLLLRRAVLLRRTALLRDPALSLWGLPLLIIGWSTAAVLWDPSVVPWQPLAAHRLVPVVLPGILLLALWMLSWLTARAASLGASRAAVALVGTCGVLALLLPPLITTLNPGLARHPSVGRYSSGLSKLISRVQLRGVGAHATYQGSISAVSALCSAIGPSATVVFVDPATAASYAPAVRSLCRQPAALLVSPGTAARADAVSAIEQVGRRPVLLGPSQSSIALSGVTSRQVVALRTFGDPRVLTGPPAGNWPVGDSLWLGVPSGA